MAGLEYESGKPKVFDNLLVYVGSFNEELIKSVKYYLYVCYGKHWRDGSEWNSLSYLLRSINIGISDAAWFAKDIKTYRRSYRKSMRALLEMVSRSNPIKTDDYALNLVTSFIYDMDNVVNAITKSKPEF